MKFIAQKINFCVFCGRPTTTKATSTSKIAATGTAGKVSGGGGLKFSHPPKTF